MLIASLFFGIGFALIAQAPNWILLVLACAFFGWAFGTLNVTQNILVCEASSERARRQWLSGLHAVYGVSALVAPLLTSFLREAGFNWRQAFMLLAIPPVLLAFAGVWNRSPKPLKESAAKPIAGKEWGTIALYAFIMAMYLWGELSASTRLVLWLRAERGFDATQADYLLAGFFLALLAGRLVFTFHSFPKWNNWFILCLSAFLGGVLYLCALHFSPWIAAAAALAMSPFYPVIMDQCSKAFGARSPQAISWIIGVGNLSLVVMHVAIGWVGDMWGVTAALHLGAVALLAVAAFSLPRLDWGR
jgi:MFS transporter, FHS family, glucose/mannose:H+ symporter